MTATASRILARVTVDAATGCHVWTGPIGSRGYGVLWVGKPRRIRTAHRVLYEELLGPIAADMQLDHLCHTRDRSCPGGITCMHRRCTNPDHLEPVTRRENIRRGQTRAGRQARQTHCKRGHPLAGANLLPNRAGFRICAQCRRDRRRTSREDQP